MSRTGWLALLLIACGGGDDGGTDGTDTPTGSTPSGTMDACMRPGLVDFGRTAADAEMTASIENKGGVEIVVDEIAIGGDRYQLVQPTLPFTLAPGDDVEVTFSFSPTNAVPSAEDIQVISGGVVVATGRFKANNCPRGIPSAYDVDGDKVCSCAGDCDDDDPNVHPGAAEVPGNLVDDDCDGEIDEAADDPSVDDDGDGYCNGVTCSDGSEPGDCDDEEPGVNPGAIEANTRRDDNCNGVIDENYNVTDEDGDGFVEEGGDCDNLDPDTHPCAPETDPSRDADCDFVNGG